MFHVPTAFNRVDGEILYGNSRAGGCYPRGNAERYKNSKGCLRKALPPRNISPCPLQGLLNIQTSTLRTILPSIPPMKCHGSRKPLLHQAHLIMSHKPRGRSIRAHYRFFKASKRLANAAKSSSGGGAGFTVSVLGFGLDVPSDSVGGRSGSFGVLTPALLASADIVVASMGKCASRTLTFSGSFQQEVSGMADRSK